MLEPCAFEEKRGLQVEPTLAPARHLFRQSVNNELVGLHVFEFQTNSKRVPKESKRILQFQAFKEQLLTFEKREDQDQVASKCFSNRAIVLVHSGFITRRDLESLTFKVTLTLNRLSQILNNARSICRYQW